MRILLLAPIPLGLLACKMEPNTVRIGGNRWPGHAPRYRADALHWMEPAGRRLVECPNAGDVPVIDRQRVAAGRHEHLKAPWYEALPLWQSAPRCAGTALQQRLGLPPQPLQDTLAGQVPGGPALNRQMREDGRLPHGSERLDRHRVEHRLPPRPARPQELLASCGDYGC
ncbi:hypothetical protein [Azotobacter beijerinckii]|uniref:Uncharacterized protein n=1 Tax=Azotobacter beijerinckii TaxID=170623 RepID=A0A1I4B8H9_9GAMM|nr:hypothetical protein [Azotobacter beijerinckii]SFB05082.1 hypothetical protein SAMN04244571_01253 [Azotobacter beijerinckii]SFK65202.1 hypothetical protein SAMN04244574_01382 [Azotobacter beijerinckii]